MKLAALDLETPPPSYLIKHARDRAARMRFPSLTEQKRVNWPALWWRPRNRRCSQCCGVGLENKWNYSKQRFVYFAQASSGGPIKIGLSERPYGRLHALSLGCPDELKCLKATLGSRRLELDLHEEFDSIRLCREWFQDTPQLRRRMAELPAADLEGLSLCLVCKGLGLERVSR